MGIYQKGNVEIREGCVKGMVYDRCIVSDIEF